MIHSLMSACLLLFAGISDFRSTKASVNARESGLRVWRGVDSTTNKYPYILAVVTPDFRLCTGTALAQEWVITAAHCFIDYGDEFYVQYGNMSIYPYHSKNKVKVLQIFPHPGSRVIDEIIDYYYDIALVQTEVISLSRYGVICAADYSSLTGLAVEFAGFGMTQEYHIEEDDKRPVQLAEGMTQICEKDGNDDMVPKICVVSKCSNVQGPLEGDSGGPLLFNGKLIGVLMGGTNLTSFYTPISPCLTWIYRVMNSK